MSDDLYWLQRDREGDLRHELEENRRNIDELRSRLERGSAAEPGAEAAAEEGGRAASVGGSLTDHVLYWRQELLKVLVESDEGKWVTRIEGEDWQNQLEALREYAADLAGLRLIEGTEQVYVEIVRRVEYLQSLVAPFENQRAQWAIRVSARDFRPWR